MTRHGFAVLAVCVVALGCDSLMPADVRSLVIHSPSTNIIAGSSLALSLRAYDGYGSEVQIGPATWTTDDASIATVDGMGRLTAHALGTAFVRARSSGLDATLAIAVVPARIAFSVTSGQSTLTPGGQLQLQATLIDAHGQSMPGNVSVVWTAFPQGIVEPISNAAGSRSITIDAAAPGLVAVRATTAGIFAEYVVAVVPEHVSATSVSVSQFRVFEFEGQGSDANWYYAPELQVIVSGNNTIHVERLDVLVPGASSLGARQLCASADLAIGTHGLLGMENDGRFYFAVSTLDRVAPGEAVALLTYKENGKERVLPLRAQIGAGDRTPFPSTYFWDECGFDG